MSMAMLIFEFYFYYFFRTFMIVFVDYTFFYVLAVLVFYNMAMKVQKM